jgi:FKBP-type peptidyl-prolyl cis-trans isomerase
MHYWIYEKGTGVQAKLDDYASIVYKVELLDGTLCYEAKKDKPGVFKIGQDAVETGIHEVVLLMRVGDKARVVLPSHLAFGLTGDSSKVPKSSPLVYDIELIALN